MSYLPKKIAVWVENKLISQDQGDAILDFEQGKKKNPFFSLMSVGFFSIACGIVALVSSNWEDISDGTKLFGMFVILGGLAYVLERLYEKKPNFFEGVLFFYALFFLACIGLVGQIFHLKSDTYKAFLFWSFLTTPLLAVSRKNLLTYVWIPVFAGSLLASPFGQELMEELVDLFEYASFAAVSLTCFIVYVLVKPLDVERLRPVMVYAVLGIVLPLFQWDFPYYLDSSSHAPKSLALVLLLIYGGGFAYTVWTKMKLSLLERKAVLGAVGFYTLLVFRLHFFHSIASLPSFLLVPVSFVSSFLTVFLLLALAFYAYASKNVRLFNVFILVLAIRILTDFFRLFGSLLATGFGLIVTGLFLLGMSYVFIRLRRIFEAQMKNDGEA